MISQFGALHGRGLRLLIPSIPRRVPSDIAYLFELTRDLRDDVAKLRRELEYLSIPWPVRYAMAIWNSCVHPLASGAGRLLLTCKGTRQIVVILYIT